MRKILSLVLVVVLVLIFFADDVLSQRSRARSASSSSGARSTSSNARSSSSSSNKSSSKTSSSRNRNSKSKNDDKDTSVKLTEEECLSQASFELLEGNCKFLKDEELLSKLTNPLYCIYNYRTKGKKLGVYDLYLSQNYGADEDNLKSTSALIKIKSSLKGAAKYYDYLIEKLNTGTLQHSQIADSLAEDIVDEEMSLSNDVIKAIYGVEAGTIEIPANLIKSDLTSCTNSIKEKMEECKYSESEEVQSLITDSCQEYESALIQNVADKRTQVLGMKNQILDVLKQRIDVANEKENLSECYGKVGDKLVECEAELACDYNTDKDEKSKCEMRYLAIEECKDKLNSEECEALTYCKSTVKKTDVETKKALTDEEYDAAITTCQEEYKNPETTSADTAS